MIVIVEYTIRQENTTTAEWLNEWSLRAGDALEAEPETSSYAAGINREEKYNVVVFERYEHGTSSLEFHMKRPSHQKLGEVMAAREMTRRRVLSVSYHEIPGIGWWQPRTPVTESHGEVTLTIQGLRLENAGDRDEYLAWLEKLSYADECADAGILVLGAGTAIADADRGIEVCRGDLAVVTVMPVDSGKRQQQLGEILLSSASGNKPSGVKPAATFRRSYQISQAGFLWRN